MITNDLAELDEDSANEEKRLDEFGDHVRFLMASMAENNSTAISGAACVDLLARSGLCADLKEARATALSLLTLGLLAPEDDRSAELDFSDTTRFDDSEEARYVVNEEKLIPKTQQKTWSADVLALGDKAKDVKVDQELLELQKIATVDEWNAHWIDNVRPKNWTNPTPKKSYDVVIVGGGYGGLECARFASKRGLKVALFIKMILGGEQLYLDWIPRHCLIRTALALTSVKISTGRFGVEMDSKIDVDFDSIMQRMRRIRSEISRRNAISKLQKTNLNVDIFFDVHPGFTSSNQIELNCEGFQEIISFKKGFIDTGTEQVNLEKSIEGISAVSHYTLQKLSNMKKLPLRLGIIGAGKAGCELAQAFRKFGSSVHLVTKEEFLIPQEDPDASKLIYEMMKRSGINVVRGTDSVRVSKGKGEKYIHFKTKESFVEQTIVVDKIIVACGTVPRISELKLEKAGIEVDPEKGVLVNDFLQTSNPRIYAIGSVCSKYISLQITEIMANIAISNAFSPFNIKRFSSACVPYYIQTTPEIARTGVLPSIAKELGIEIDTYVENFSNLEGAMIQGNRVGFVKIICKKGTDEIMGAVIVGDKPNDMISTMSLALHQKISLSKLSQIFHAYPTLSKAIQNCAILCEEKLRSSSRFSFIYKYFAF